MAEELVSRSIELPSGELRLLQPQESAELPDTGAVEWAPVAPYWSVLGAAAWRSRASSTALRSAGCAPSSLARPAKHRGARRDRGLATDACFDPLTLVARHADANDVRIDTAKVDWAQPDELVSRAPFELVLAADVLYERASVGLLLSLLPRLVPEAWLADPGRPAAGAFIEQARCRLPIETRVRGVVQVHRPVLG